MSSLGSTSARSASILSWISDLPSPTPGERKRARPLGNRDSNMMTDREEWPSKRRKLLQSPELPDDTLRPLRRDAVDVSQRLVLGSQRSGSPSHESSRSSNTHSSRSSSPVKKMADVLWNPEPILMKQFHEPNCVLPPELETIVSEVQRLSRGLGVIAEASRVSRSA